MQQLQIGGVDLVNRYSRLITEYPALTINPAQQMGRHFLSNTVDFGSSFFSSNFLVRSTNDSMRN